MRIPVSVPAAGRGDLFGWAALTGRYGSARPGVGAGAVVVPSAGHCAHGTGGRQEGCGVHCGLRSVRGLC